MQALSQKKEHSLEECPLNFNIDGYRIPILIEIGFSIFDDFIPLIKGQTLDEEGRGVFADIHQLCDWGVAHLH